MGIYIRRFLSVHPGNIRVQSDRIPDLHTLRKILKYILRQRDLIRAFRQASFFYFADRRVQSHGSLVILPKLQSQPAVLKLRTSDKYTAPHIIQPVIIFQDIRLFCGKLMETCVPVAV